jgi:hypothetical protein
VRRILIHSLTSLYVNVNVNFALIDRVRVGPTREDARTQQGTWEDR